MTLTAPARFRVAGPSMRVLIVQADPGLLARLTQGMEAAGIAVEPVGSAAETIAAATRREPSVIILDAILPDGDGFSLCRMLRDRGVQTPILFLTTRGSVSDRVHGLEVGADDYVTTPVSVQELTARLRALVRRASIAPLSLRCGDLHLDRVGHRASREETVIPLSAREFAVLEALMLNPELVLSRDDLLERAWGSRLYGPSNVVDVYIGYLRRKIDKPFDRHSLQTVRGSGYRISSES